MYILDNIFIQGVDLKTCKAASPCGPRHMANYSGFLMHKSGNEALNSFRRQMPSAYIALITATIILNFKS